MQSTFSSHGFDLSNLELAQFEKLLELFMTYNSHTNLSAIRDQEGIIEKHFIDSLYGVSIINDIIADNKIHKTPKLLDIGSGGGFPGIPLKIVFPEVHMTLLDSVGKKVNAMNHFISELHLSDITAIQERAEVLAKKSEYAGQYDFVVSRATAYMTDILTWAEPFLSQDGHIILYKMPSEDEQKEIRKVSKKLGLIFQGELEYVLGGKERVLYDFVRR